MTSLRERRRILVVGSGGAGKSTFARRLGELTGLPVVHLDRHFWRAGWKATPTDEWNATSGAVSRHARVDHGRQLRGIAGHPGPALRRGRVLRLSSPDLSVGRFEALAPLPGPKPSRYDGRLPRAHVARVSIVDLALPRPVSSANAHCIRQRGTRCRRDSRDEPTRRRRPLGRRAAQAAERRVSASSREPELRFEPIDLSSAADIAIRFQADAFQCSFNSTEGFYEADGKGHERYLVWLAERMRSLPGSCVHVWSGDSHHRSIADGSVQARPAARLRQSLLFGAELSRPRAGTASSTSTQPRTSRAKGSARRA